LDLIQREQGHVTLAVKPRFVVFSVRLMIYSSEPGLSIMIRDLLIAGIDAYHIEHIVESGSDNMASFIASQESLAERPSPHYRE